VRTVYRQEAHARGGGKLAGRFFKEHFKTWGGLTPAYLGTVATVTGNLLGLPAIYVGAKYFKRHVDRVQPALLNLQEAQHGAVVATLQRLNLTGHPTFQRAEWVGAPAAGRSWVNEDGRLRLGARIHGPNPKAPAATPLTATPAR
jgi:hypothetical protein